MLALHLLIHGKVQGVAYRASAAHEARRLGLSGWVCNRADGTVEAMVAGPEDPVEEFVRWCRKGPPLARVARIDRSPAPEGKAMPDPFVIRR